MRLLLFVTAAVVLFAPKVQGLPTDIYRHRNLVIRQIGNCSQGDVRLVNGGSALEGRVEVCNSNEWGTVCDDQWDLSTEGDVVCRQLGHGGAIQVFGGAFFGQGTGEIVLDDLQCTGSESSLFDCPRDVNGLDDCSHAEDAGVICAPVVDCGPLPPPTNGTLILFGPSTVGSVAQYSCNEGFVLSGPDTRICQANGTWSGHDPTCADSCNPGEFLCLFESHCIPQNLTCDGNPDCFFDYDEQQCFGVECSSSEFYCSQEQYCIPLEYRCDGISDCLLSFDEFFFCPMTFDNCTNGDVRIVDGPSDFEGRVELCDGNAWSPVCEQGWDFRDASVVCRQLGYPSAGIPIDAFSVTGTVGSGSPFGPIREVSCQGNEAYLINCPRSGDDDCEGFAGAGVLCQAPENCTDGDLRLVGGGDVNEGRVEICYSGIWGSVCGSNWGYREAAVVCQQLGYDPLGAIGYQNAFFGEGQSPVITEGVYCGGGEANFLECIIDFGGNCSSSYVGVTCDEYLPDNCSDGDVRLSHREALHRGQVQVCVNDTWGTVCSNFWDDTDASVVCRQLGFFGEGHHAIPYFLFGPGEGPVHLTDLACSGTEANLLMCSSETGGLGLEFCEHGNDASVQCAALPRISLVPPISNNTYTVEENREFQLRCRADNNNFIPTILFATKDGVRLETVRNGNDLTVIDFEDGFDGIRPEDGGEYICVAENSFGRTELIFTIVVSVPDLDGSSSKAFMRFSIPVYHRVLILFTLENDGGDDENSGSNDGEGNPRDCEGGGNPGPGRDGEGGNPGPGGDGEGGGPGQITPEFLRLLINAAVFEAFPEELPGQQTVNCSYVARRQLDIERRLQRVECEINNYPSEENITDTTELASQILQNGDGPRVFSLFNISTIGFCDAELAFTSYGAYIWPETEAGSTLTLPCALGPVNATASRVCSVAGEWQEPLLDGCSNDTAVCSDVEFLCPFDNTCVPGDSECNGTEECGSGFDEYDCPVMCSPEEFMCVMENRCISRDLLCDFTYHCFDGSDERGCPGQCEPDELLCQFELRCIPSEYECDGIYDCLSSFDEFFCPMTFDNCTNGDVRIVDGPSDFEGRVELCDGNAWSPICEQGWDFRDASVVCRQLGYPSAGIPIDAFSVTGTVGSGSPFGPIREVSCQGNEAYLINCPRSGDDDCEGFAGAGVLCQAPENCTDGDLRLVGGGDVNEGRVEICYSGIWGSVCGSNWGYREAAVVCQQLGYDPLGAIGYQNAFFGEGQSPVITEGVYCGGGEANFLECIIDFGGNCSSRYVGVTCDEYLPDNCSDGDVRLSHREALHRGQVQVCVNDTWGTVCSNFWDDTDASVVCRQLGFFGEGHHAIPYPLFGPGEGPVHLTDLACSGTEANLLMCSSETGGLGLEFCDHGNDASVQCAAFPRISLVPPISNNTYTVEENREFQLRCRADNSNFIPTILFATKDGIRLETEIYGNDLVVVDFEDEFDGIRPENGGEYICVAENAFGRTELIFTIVVSVPDLDGSSSKAFMRFSIPVYHRVLILFTLGNDGGDDENSRSNDGEGNPRDCEGGGNPGPGGDGEGGNPGPGGAGEGGGPGGDGEGGGPGHITPEFLRLLLNAAVFEAFPEELPGQQTVNCSYVARRQLDIERRLQRVECEINNYPSEENITDTTELASQILQNGDGPRVFSLFNISIIGFCDAELAFTPYGAYIWPETEAGSTLTLPCALGPVNATASRVCSVAGEWQEPLLDGCSNDTAVCSDVEFLCPFDNTCVPGDSECNGTEECGSGFDEYDCPVTCSPEEFMCVMENRCISRDLLCDFTYHCFDGSDERGCPGRCEPDELLCKFELRCIPSEYECDGYVDCLFPIDEAFCPAIPSNCTTGDIRLVDGVTELEGRVEICIDGVFGAVCENDWDARDATVACRQMGPYVGIPLEGIDGFVPLNLRYLQCFGNESSLLDCLTMQPGEDRDSCDSGFDAAAMRCMPPESCEDGELRLIDGESSIEGSEGQVEICFLGIWGGVASSLQRWEYSDAAVVCNQLGYNPLGALALTNTFTESDSILLDYVDCSGTEVSLLDCPGAAESLGRIPVDDDDNGEDDRNVVAVRCDDYPATGCSDGDVRLTHRDSISFGRVQVCLNNTWGGVCSNSWDDTDAIVVCGQLGFLSYGGYAFVGPQIIEGLVHLTDVACNGTEAELLECSAETDVSPFCNHAGVQCARLPVIHVVPPSPNGTYHVEVGRDFELYCSTENTFPGNESSVVVFRAGEELQQPDNSTDRARVVDFSDGVGISPGDAGEYSCVATNPGGVTEETITIFVQTPDIESNASSSFIRFSFPEFDRLILLFNNDNDDEDGGFADSPESFLLQLQGYVLEAIDEDLPGIQVVDCYYVGRLLMGAERRYDRAECNITTYPAIENTIELADLVLRRTRQEINIFFFPITSANGFCDSETIGDYHWMEAEAGMTIFMSCPFGPEYGIAYRMCKEDRQWDDPQIDQCNGAPPPLVLNPMEENGLYMVTIGSKFELVCQTFDHSGSVSWQRLDGSGSRLLGGVSGENYAILEVDVEEGGIQPVDEGTYQCLTNDASFGSANVTVTILVWVPEETGSTAFLRFSVQNLTNIEEIVNDTVSPELAILELTQAVREVIYDFQDYPYPVFPNCSFVQGRAVDIENYWLRMECVLFESPPGNLTFELAKITAELLPFHHIGVELGILINSTAVASANGFCDAETISPYYWMETETDIEIVVTCPFGPEYGIAYRMCGGDRQWDDPQTDQCNEPCQDRAVRLVDGSTEREGRVEICFGNIWGTVCDDSWDYRHAMVVCGQLDYNATVSSQLEAYFGEGSGPIHLDDVECIGNESHLADCEHDGLGNHNCGHDEDAGVVCAERAPYNCTNGEIRLAGAGASAWRGRVEICTNGIFGTVCDDWWDDLDAAVVCRQLGYPLAVSAQTNAFFGRGSGDIFLDEVECAGNESYLIDCDNFGLYRHDCVHSEDAGVICGVICTPDEFLCPSEPAFCVPDSYMCDGINDCLYASDELNCPVIEVFTNCTDGEIRLVNGTTENEGIVEICVSGTYGTICDDDWDIRDARVVCRQLGLPTVGIPFTASSEQLIGTGPIHLGRVDCLGSENSLFECSSGHPRCDHLQDAGVRCQGITPENCTDGDLRLVGGGDVNEGRVEICYSGIWGGVCEYDWEYRDATVVCQQLGYDPLGALALPLAFFGEGPDPTIINYVYCEGSEAKLLDCDVSFGYDCSHELDVGVRCEDYQLESCTDGDVRLTHRLAFNYGQVQVCVNGTWGTVCSSHWDDNEALVVCRQLGFPEGGHEAIPYPLFGPGEGPVHLSDLACNGTEANLLMCSLETYGDVRRNVESCDHVDDASVQCADVPRIRLVPPSPSGTYHVEVGRGFELKCFADDYSIPQPYLSIYRNNSLITSGNYDVYIFINEVNGEGISPEDGGEYSCVAENTLGRTELNFTIVVSVPNLDDSSSGLFMRFSVVEFDRAVLLYEDRSGSIFRGIMEFTQETLLNIIHSRILSLFPEDVPGVATVYCSYVSRRLLDIERRFQRTECFIINYPQIDNLMEIAEFIALYLEIDSSPLSLFNVSENGFCDGEVIGSYYWPETEVGVTAVLPCSFGLGGSAFRMCSEHRHWEDPVVPEQCIVDGPFCEGEATGEYYWPDSLPGVVVQLSCVFGPEDGKAFRTCRQDGQWEDPQFDDCDLLLFFPPREDGTYTATEGSRFELICKSYDDSGSVSWRRADGSESQLVSDQGGESYAFLKADIRNGGLQKEDEGLYECVAEEASFGTEVVTVEIIVKVLTEPVSTAFLRFSIQNLTRTSIIFGENITTAVAILEFNQVIRDIVINLSYPGFVFPDCRLNAGRRGIDITNYWLRVECKLNESPVPSPASSTSDLAMMVALNLPLHEVYTEHGLVTDIDSIIASENGFCDYDTMNSIINGNYTWMETVAGTHHQPQECEFGQAEDNGMARRQCSSIAEWEDPDFSECIDRLPDIEFSLERPDLRYSVDIGRRFSLTCSSPESDPFQGDVNWLFGDTTVTSVEEGEEFDFAVGIGSGEWGDLLPDPMFLYTERPGPNRSNTSITLATHPDYGAHPKVEGTYTCQAMNEFGTFTQNIFLRVQGPQGDLSGVLRVSVDVESLFGSMYLDELKLEYFFLHIEALFLDQIPENDASQESVECYRVGRRPEDVENNWERIECAVYSSPPQDDLIQDMADAITNGAISPFLIVLTVHTSEYRFCDYEKTVTTRGDFVWDETEGNSPQLRQSCITDPADGIPADEAFISRMCDNTGNWTEVELRRCITVVSQELRDLERMIAEEGVTEENFEELTEELTELIGNSTEEDQTETNLAIVIEVFAGTAALVSDPQATVVIDESDVNDYVVVVDDIQGWNEEVLETMGSEVIESFEIISVGLFEQDNFTNVTIVGVSISFTAENIEVDLLQTSGRSFSSPADNETLPETGPGNETAVLAPEQVANAFLPPSLFTQIEGAEEVGVVFTLYTTPVLFRPVGVPNTTRVGSSVVGATVAGHSFSNLDDPVIIVLRILPVEDGNITRRTCVSWDFEAGNWTTEGCVTEEASDDDVVRCLCNHLTNFACLVDICSRTEGCDDNQPSDEEALALNIISIVGVCLSLVGIVLTIITLLAFEKLRKRDATKYHVQLCIALGLMLLVFVVGIDRTEVDEVCVAVSALIHYFTLVSVMWMGAEAVLMFQKLVIVFVQITNKYIIGVSLVCWLVPIVPVIIPLGIDRDFMVTFTDSSEEDIDFCFIGEVGVFFGAFLGPIFAILLFNSVIFVIVTVVLIRHTRSSLGRMNKEKMNRKSTIRLLISLAGIMALFGVTWLFAALTVEEASLAFQFLFAIFNSLQGFFIFLFFCVISKDARELWKDAFTRHTPKGQYLSNTSGPSPTRINRNRPRSKATLSSTLSSSVPPSTFPRPTEEGKKINLSTVTENPYVIENEPQAAPSSPVLKETNVDSGDYFENPAATDSQGQWKHEATRWTPRENPAATDSSPEDKPMEGRELEKYRWKREATRNVGVHETEMYEIDFDEEVEDGV